jgi:hypothetical protein
MPDGTQSISVFKIVIQEWLSTLASLIRFEKESEKRHFACSLNVHNVSLRHILTHQSYFKL